MRIIDEQQRYFDFTKSSSLKIVLDYQKKYLRISKLLDSNPKLLKLAHQDWEKLLSTSQKGRQAKYTSDSLLRALIVKCLEQESYRSTVIRIDTSEFLRYFVRLGHKPTMGFSLLCDAFGILAAETLKAMNQTLSQYAVENDEISFEKQRLDSTAYETHIHYPTDSALLWDSFRTVARLVSDLRSECPELNIIHRFHTKKVKKLHTYIGRNASGKKKTTRKKVKKTYRLLIQRVQWIYDSTLPIMLYLNKDTYHYKILAHYLPLVAQIISQADQRVLQGISLGADEKLYSLFEEHTELIKRGKAGKAIEFGHKVLIAQTEEKYIHHYTVTSVQCSDIDLLPDALKAHKKVFGKFPELLAADKGFYESMDQIHTLEKDIKTVSIGKKGSRTKEELAREHTESFKQGQAFRAGVEGSISVLKRVFSLSRCFYKGFKNYAASVGLAVLCHNLVLLAQ